MTLPVQSFGEIVAQQQSSMNASSSQLITFAPGSILLSLIEANAGNSLWLQAIATSLLSVTRLSTSSGNDVDTFIADFGFSRYQGNAASGAVTFSRLSTGIQGVIPVGTIVSASAINNLSFIVTVPPAGVSYPAYDPVNNQYAIGSSSLNCLAPVTCQQIGTIGNVGIGQINTINSSLIGVTMVSNAIAYANGLDIWNDSQTKAEFALYVQSLARATGTAINYAISIVPGVQRWFTIENINQFGQPQLGYFYAVVDGGSGVLSPSLQAAVKASVELYRGFSIQYAIIAPTPITANIAITINLVATPTETNAQIILNIQNAVLAYVNSLAIGQTLFVSRLPELAYDADLNVKNVSTYTINGSGDLSCPNPYNVIIPGTITVTIV